MAKRAQDTEAAWVRAPLTDRVNVEPAILHGMTATEAKWIALASFLLFLLLAGLIFSSTGWWQMPLLLAMIGPILTLWFGSKYLARIKRGRPDGYYGQALNLWLAERRLAKPEFITHTGWWSLGRELDLSLASPLHPPAERFEPTGSSPIKEHE